ncbi:hypothetical protein [Agromyces sp. Soil535]|uniref:hypothetical protein n=1 Tax=Agromyces sp. Soil535 TaxID=1736390 RepID=UPI0012E3E52A|nr:hypothetical protein [Agromyces sp. Soil535]
MLTSVPVPGDTYAPTEDTPNAMDPSRFSHTRPDRPKRADAAGYRTSRMPRGCGAASGGVA